MKTNHLVIAITTIGLIQLSACGKESDEIISEQRTTEAAVEFTHESNSFATSIDQFPITELTEREKNGLQFMREEEKLARDVYLTLYDKWSLVPFKNISKSEQAHMDAIFSLLNRYALKDPAEGKDIGEFTNTDLQKLYDDLIARGSVSAVEALNVGALIEEMDIMDIQRLLDEDFESEAIEFVMTNLLRGSVFHLKAFVWNLKKYSIVYQPKLLNINTFNEILN
jgi:hypothetical protein